MSDVIDVQRTRKPPPGTLGPIGWLRENLFSSWLNSALTLAMLGILYLIIPPFYRWGIANAVFAADSNKCREMQGIGACWGIITEKYRLILMGLYPYEEQWRPALMVVMLLVMIGISMYPRFWRPWLAWMWLAAVVAMAVLMWGGILGLPFVETEKWGGLPLTLILSVNGIVFSFPLAIVLALGRRSHLPVISSISTAFIELMRGVPLITVLFMASLMIPLFLPSGFDINKLLRAQIGIILFGAAYLAEVIRGGLQSLPKGQAEAADSLGLSYWQSTRLIILPQALRTVIPPMVNSFIAGFKDTSLVIIIGLFDLLGTARQAINAPEWRPFYVEALIFIALIYFVCCFTLATYSRFLERRSNTGNRRS